MGVQIRGGNDSVVGGRNENGGDGDGAFGPLHGDGTDLALVVVGHKRPRASASTDERVRVCGASRLPSFFDFVARSRTATMDRQHPSAPPPKTCTVGLKRQRESEAKDVTASKADDTNRVDWQQHTKKRKIARCLQFALPELSSVDTLKLLGELGALRHELSWLSNTQPTNVDVHPVFGWRSAVWKLESPGGDDVVVKKAAKAFEGVSSQAVANRIWWSGAGSLPVARGVETVYSISRQARVVKHQPATTSDGPQLWLESVVVSHEGACIMRKLIPSLKHNPSDNTNTTTFSCQGYLIKSMMVPVGARLITGTAVRSICSTVSSSNPSAQHLTSLIQDLPKTTLEWEETFVHANC